MKRTRAMLSFVVFLIMIVSFVLGCTPLCPAGKVEEGRVVYENVERVIETLGENKK